MKLLGLIGYPLSHSFSKKYFEKKFLIENNKEYTYELFPLKNISEISDLVNSKLNLIGLNVTIPYKEKVIPYLDAINPEAERIGAVNTVKIERSNKNTKLIGYNTDIYGFKQSIKPYLKNIHERALILGTGGAAKAVGYVFSEMGIDCIYISRKPSAKNEYAYKDVNQIVLSNYKIIVNCTPVGMFPFVEEAPELPYKFLNSTNFLIDLIYNPEKTKFLTLGSKYGAQTLNGLSMLQLQAEKSWEIWNEM